jgi:glycosyltransferase involved in cell wall biosynthesis
MKILYIGNYNDRTGWGAAAKANILALNAFGIDVVARVITFGNQGAIDPIIQQLENKSCAGADIIIQHALPQYYYRNSKALNLGFYCVETDDFYVSKWHKYINQMDGALVMSDKNIHVSKNSGVNIPLAMFRYSIDPSKYNLDNKTATIKELDDTFNFCYVGEWNHRKGLDILLRAFYTEFHRSEPVNLFVKLSSNMGPESCLAEFNKLNEHIKSGLKIKKHRNISVVCTPMEYEHYLSLINQCHAFVCASRGEACCIPMLEAQAMGLRAIATGDTGMDDYIVEGSSVLSHPTDCFGMQSTLPEIQTGYEQWREIDTTYLRSTMRSVYEFTKPEKEKISEKTKQLFSHAAIGKEVWGNMSWILSSR